MSSGNRADQFAHLRKVLKKHYKPVTPDPQRPVLEHLLYACLLENAHYEKADEAYAAVVDTFFDFNELRVTTVSELAEVMAGLPEPRAAAHRLKRVLQSVFEATYDFNLEEWHKKNLGPAIKYLQKVDGTTGFSVSYVVQSAPGGHSIPIDSGAAAALWIVDLIGDNDREKLVAPGMERAIAKAKGIEFGSLLHQLGADLHANPFSPAVRSILLEVEPAAKERFPKRRTRKPAAPPAAETKKEPAAPATAKPDAKKPGAAKKKPTAKKKTPAKPIAKKKGTKKKRAAERLSKKKPR